MSLIKRLFGGKRSSGVDLTGHNSMFGSIANQSGAIITTKSGMDFLPKDKRGGIFFTGENHNPKWLGLSSPTMQLFAYMYCSPLASVIDRLAEADTNGIFTAHDADGNVVKSFSGNPRLKRVINLLRNPNAHQTYEDWNTEQIVHAKIFGYSLAFVLSPFQSDMSYSKAIYNVNPLRLKPVPNPDFDMMDENSKPILRYDIVGGPGGSIDTEYIMVIRDGYYTDTRTGMPLSKVAGLDYAVSNVCAAMEADNVLLKKKGPLGVFSYDPKPDMGGWTPMEPENKDSLQEDLNQYGLTAGQFQYIISPLPIKWSPMSFNAKDLMTKETTRQSIEAICDRMGYPAELMSGKNATYENRDSAAMFLYQNSVIPFSQRRTAAMNKFFGVSGLTKTFGHLTVLQDDIQKAGMARYNNSKSLEIDWKAGIITWNEYRKEQGLDQLPGGDIYYPEWAKKNEIKITKDEVASENTGTEG